MSGNHFLIPFYTYKCIRIGKVFFYYMKMKTVYDDLNCFIFTFLLQSYFIIY